MGAIITSLDVAAERFGATNLYRRHDATLGEAEMALVGGAPAGSVAAEHVRHLQTRPRHRRIVSSATLAMTLAVLGLPETSRPEELAPSQFVDLARELQWP